MGKAGLARAPAFKASLVSHFATEISSLNISAVGIAPRARLLFPGNTACSVCWQHGFRRTVVPHCEGDRLTQKTRENYIMREFIILLFTPY